MEGRRLTLVASQRRSGESNGSISCMRASWG
jgi:hypothetical protein